MENNHQQLPPPAICPNCGLRYDPRRPNCPRCGTPHYHQQRPQSPELQPKKKTNNPLLVPLIVVSVLAIVSCVLWLTNRPSGSDVAMESKPKSTQEKVKSDKAQSTTKANTSQGQNKNTFELYTPITLESCEVTFTDISLVFNPEGHAGLKFVFDFTSNKDNRNDKMPNYTFSLLGYQNGVETRSVRFFPEVDTSIGRKQIKPGDSISGVERAVPLDDDSKPVTIELGPLLGHIGTIYTLEIENPSELKSQPKSVKENTIDAEADEFLNSMMGDVHLTDEQLKRLVDKYTNTELGMKIDITYDALMEAQNQIEDVRQSINGISAEKFLFDQGAGDSDLLILELENGVRNTNDYLNKEIKAQTLSAALFSSESDDVHKTLDIFTRTPRNFQERLDPLIERLSELMYDTELNEDEKIEATIKLAEDVLDVMIAIEQYYSEVQELAEKYMTN